MKPPTATPSLSPVGWRRELGEKERRKNVGRDKYIIVSEGKRGETTASDAKAFTLHLPKQAGAH